MDAQAEITHLQQTITRLEDDNVNMDKQIEMLKKAIKDNLTKIDLFKNSITQVKARSQA